MSKKAIVNFIPAQGPSPLLTNLEVYWKFDDNTGTSATDATGNGHTGTLLNGSTWVTGQINSGVSFANTAGGAGSQVISFTGIAAGTVWSWAGWVKPTSTTGYQNLMTQFASDGIWLNSGKIDYYVGGGDHLSSTTLTTGVFNHCSITVNGTAVAFYLNGATDGTATLGATHSQIFGIIGQDSSGGAATEGFNGVLDEYGLWTRVLSSSEVSQLYNTGSGLQYPF